jgi:hypothetical protein
LVRRLLLPTDTLLAATHQAEQTRRPAELRDTRRDELQPAALPRGSDCIGNRGCSGVVLTRGFALTAHKMGEGQVRAESRFGAAELGVVGVECSGEHSDGFWVPEAGEGVVAPAGEVDGVEGDVGPVWEAFWLFGRRRSASAKA